MRRKSAGGFRLSWPLVIATGMAVAAAVVVVGRAMPEESRLHRVSKEVEDFATNLPARVESLIHEEQARFARAKVAFSSARADAERVLTAQFQEAKQRGSLPPG